MTLGRPAANTRNSGVDFHATAGALRAPATAARGRLMRSGEHVVVLNERGRPIGAIYSPVGTPPLGRNQATCYLRR